MWFERNQAKIQQKDQQCVTIMQSRLANKKRLLATPTRKPLVVML